MFARGGFDAKASRGKLSGTKEAIDMLVALAQDDEDKAFVMTYVGRLVADGYAEWAMLDSGEIEVRFTSGETYLLAEATILRLV